MSVNISSVYFCRFNFVGLLLSVLFRRFTVLFSAIGMEAVQPRASNVHRLFFGGGSVIMHVIFVDPMRARSGTYW